MALAARYYVTAPNGIYIDLSYSRPGFGKPEHEFDIRGGAGSDWLYAPSGSSADFTQAGTGNDILYVTGNFADYTQSINDTGMYTLSRSLAGGAVETIRFKAEFDDDVVYFADGHVVLNLDSSGLLDENAGTFRPIAAADLQPGGTPAHPLTDVPMQQHFATRVYIFQPGGVDIPALSAPGQASFIYGGAGNDCVDVRAGTSVDFSQPGTGMDKLFLSGRLSDYSQSIVDNVYTLTRIAGLPAGQTEVVRVTSDFEDDYIYFADGYINLNAEAMQPSGTPLMDPDSGIFRQMELADYVGVMTITALSEDAGTSASDFITTVAAQTVSGTLSGVLKAGEVIQVSADGGVSWVNASISGTSWSAESVILIAGTHQLTTRIRDTDGKSVPGASKEYTLDTSISSVIINAAMALSHDTGASASDFITSVAAQTVSGTFAGAIASGEKIQVSVDGGASWVDATLSGSSWSATLTLQPGSGELAVRFVNADGESSYSVRHAYALDTTVSLPTLHLQAASDLGASSGDGITNDATPSFDVTGENGATIVLFNDSNGNGIADAGEILGSVTLTGTAGTINSNALGDGAYSNIKVLQTDVAGNVSAASAPAAALVIDTSIPTAPAFQLQAASDTGTSNSDGITADNTPTFNVSGENGSTVTLFNDSNGNGFIDAGEFIGSTTLTGTAGTITGNTLSDGVYSNIKARQTDTAGNISIASVAAPAITVKTAAPSMPTLQLQAASDTGISNSDGITSDNTPTFNVTGENGATVALFNDSNNNGVVDAGEILGSVALSGTFGSITSIPLSNGTYTKLKVQQTDAAGNTSVASAAGTALTIDATAPAAPTLQLQAASDTGISNSDGITSVNTPTFNVTGENGATVALFNDSNSNGVMDAGESLGSITLSGTSGSITSIPLGDGSYNIKAMQSDMAGNASNASAASTTIVIDTTAPPAPLVQLQAASDTGSSNSDRITTDNTPSFDVTGEAGATIILFNDSNGNGVVDAGESLGSVTLSGTSGTITSNVLGEGVYSYIRARQIDAAGNSSVASVVQQPITIRSYNVDLSSIAAGSGGFAINGECGGDRSGFSVSSAGDVNGDGLVDVIVGAHQSDRAGRVDIGRSYVIFGKSDSTATVELSAITAGIGGFAINGQCASDYSGWSVSAAGDVNGDGLADVIVGACQGDPPGRTNAGRSYVIFGKTGTTEVDLSAIAAGTGGFVINGQCAVDLSGYSVSSAGDVNADGLGDLIIGKTNGTGRSYVVYGKTSMTVVDLSAVAAGIGGFVINGECGGDRSGSSVSSAGDVNGDGLTDVIVGAYQSDAAVATSAGRAYIVFGKRDTAVVDLSAVTAGTGGFTINGVCGFDETGYAVSSAGDVNGDGLADLVVGAWGADPAARDLAGRTYVVFGKADAAAVNLAAIGAGTGGFVINGECAVDRSGVSVAYAGDLNGDGLADLIIGAQASDPAGINSAGRSYVVYGKTDTAAIELSAITAGTGGFAINGQSVSDFSGQSVASAGDVDGDGLADLIVGAYSGDPPGRTDAGRSYVLLSSRSYAFAASLTQLGTSGADTLTGTAGNDRIAAGAGNDSIIGNGGADVIYGGAGNDVIELNASNVANLASSRIDGGTGTDTLKLNGSGITLDLSALTDVAIKGIEKIDLSGSGNNVLRFKLTDMIGLMDPVSHQLIVDGDAGDKIVALHSDSDQWIAGGTSGAYTVYTNSQASAVLQLLVKSGVQLISLRTPPLRLQAASDTGISASDGITRDTTPTFDVEGESGTTVTLFNDVNNNGVIDAGESLGSVVLAGTAGTITSSALADGTYNMLKVRQSDTDGHTVIVSATGAGITIDTVAPSVPALQLQAASDTGPSDSDRITNDSTLTFDITGESDATVTLFNDRNNNGIVDAGEALGSVILTGTAAAITSSQLSAGAYSNIKVIQSDRAGNLSSASAAHQAITMLMPAISLSDIAAGVNGFVINGQCSSDASGYSVSSAGDVNGDGLSDLIVGAPAAFVDTGRTYIVFGKTNALPVNLSAIAAGSGGFMISGGASTDANGTSVSSAGDMNGDGLADIIVGSGNTGKSYVVFGKSANTATVNLSDIAAGQGGFVINAQNVTDVSGRSVSFAGDVNGDGLMDVIVGAPLAQPSASQAGRSYVVYGKTDTTMVYLSDVAAGSGGFVINGQCVNDQSGSSVSAAGDVNGDGLADFIVGARFGDVPGRVDAGRSYVVFGKTNSTAVDVSGIVAGTGGFAINGHYSGESAGYSVSAAGDVNGDGLADLVIGSPYNDFPGGIDAGRSYVVYGKTNTDTVELSAIVAGSGGFVINGQTEGDRSGFSVSSAGDLNGDGLGDLIVGAYQYDPVSGADAGRTYIIYGVTSTAPIELSAVAAGTGGFEIDGQCAADYSGWSVKSAGDVDGDGLADLIIGAPQSDPAAGGNAGRSYVLLSSQSFSSSASITQWGTAGADTLTGTSGNDRIAAGAGNDSIIGNGGADVIYGGAGNDVIELNASSVANLAGSRIDGGSGTDTLRLNGSGITLDLSTLTDVAIRGIEKIDLTGSGNNTLKLKFTDMFNMLDATAHKLFIDGNAGDIVQHNGSGFWILSGIDTTTNPGHTYNIFTNSRGNPLQQVWIDNALQTVADGALPAADLSMTLVGQTGFAINGQCSGDQSGWSVASAGDVNGDGLADVIVGALFNTPTAGLQAGRSYVVYGKANTTAVDLSAIAAGTGGFVINGECIGDNSGRSVASAGDINGDGLADLIIGADQSDPGTRSNSGRSYVVFGKTDGAAINLSAITAGTGGFVINGQCTDDQSGWSVASAGDVNGDGLADVIVGAPLSDPSSRADGGRTYVVFGKTTTAAVNLSAIAGAAGGFVINGQCAGDNSGVSASYAGDVNGDGLADLIVGANLSDPSAGVAAGRSYIVYGKTSTTAINLSGIAAGTGGFVINGQCGGDSSGWSVSSAGDVNGDGLADLVVGATTSDPAVGLSGGRSYVVFGKTDSTAVDLSAIAAGTGGFVINGQCAGDESGVSVASAGDVNGDGLADLIVGAHWSDPATGANAGRSYVVYGKTTTTAVDLSAIDAGTGGFVINGQCANDESGWSVSSAGDVDGDGLADLIIGAYASDPGAGSNAGRSYVLLSSQSFSSSASITQWGTAGADTLTGTSGNDRIAAGAGNDSIIGNGGADVIYGGAGNDVIELNASGVANLASSRIDGGSGTDTLRLNGSGITLDLSTLTDVAIRGIEKIDLTGSGNNTLKLKFTDMFNMLDATAHKLFIDGNAGDTVQRVGTWTAAGTDTTSFAGHTYNVYTYSAGNAMEKLLIENTITVV